MTEVSSGNEPVVRGLTLRMSAEAHQYPEVVTMTEEHGREAFKHKYGFEATDTVWMHEEAHMWEDPDTGELLPVPEMWMLIVEGLEPA